MRSPAEMKTIQIEITNACVHSCSNCTRFCGHHRKPFFMDWPTFERAVDSLKGYDGIIGLMGGEPLLHPAFERMTRYLSQCHGMDNPLPSPRLPVSDFMAATLNRQSANMVLNRCKGPGLWTSMPVQYYKHYELIQDSFVFQNLNDHCNPSYHQPMLIARKDLGVPDEEWERQRDACWIQNCWSASINPKGAFFCEMAAALDMLFEGPGGWPIEPGWWQRKPEEFGDQLHWCEMCGAALETTRRNANEGIDDVSKSLLDKIAHLKSPKYRQGRVALYPPNDNPAPGETKVWAEFQPNQYIPDSSQRLGTTNTNLLPKEVKGIILCWPGHDKADLLHTLEAVLEQCDQTVLLYKDAVHNHTGLQNLSDAYISNNRIHTLNMADRGLGLALYKAMHGFDGKDWVVVMDAGRHLPPDFREVLDRTFLNPGVFHVLQSTQNQYGFSINCSLFHRGAQALRQAGFDGMAQCTDMEQVRQLWPADKQIELAAISNLNQDTNVHEWQKNVDQHFCKDVDFRYKLNLVLSQAVSRNEPLLVLQSASFFLTRGLVIMLMDLGYNPYLVTHKRFKANFQDILSNERIWTFDCCDGIKHEELREFCTSIKKQITFAGAIIPYSISRDVIEAGDGYQDVEKLAIDIAGRILCRVNLKRRFVSSEPQD